MRLIFVRHGEPDYTTDSLTEKGKREALLLSERVKTWDNITDYYVSPLGRAQETASYSLKAVGRTAETLDWLREFDVPMVHEKAFHEHIPWDLLADYWRDQPDLYDKDRWIGAEIYENTAIREKYENVRSNFLKLLEKYGVYKDGNVFKTDKKDDDTTLVFFCHLGVSFLCISMLLGISPVIMWHTMFVATSSLTIVNAEERVPGILNFRIQALSDTTHLAKGGEPISESGYFHEVFQK